MIENVEVRTWDELTHVLYDIPKTAQGRYRSSTVYRGVADQSWPLLTSLKRLGPAAAEVEGPLLRSFAKYAGPGEVSSDGLWFRLALAQHHGLPTRLLDWSFSPKVGLHFATYEEQWYDRDGVVWCVDVAMAAESLPQPLRDRLRDEHADLFSLEMLEGLNSLADFDALGAEGPFAVFFEPPSLDARIVNQGAVLSAMPGVDLDLGAFLRDHPQPLCRRVVLPKGLKWEIRDKLDGDNVTERMLFPGLDGLSRWLKRYYGPGPLAAPGDQLPTSDPRDEPHQRG